MNPGIFNFMVMVVGAILFATGWSARYVHLSGLRNIHWSFFLICVGVFGLFNIRVNHFFINLGCVFVVILILLYCRFLREYRVILYFMFTVLTTASICVIAIMLVPFDPAFYLLGQCYLYPAVSITSAYLFSRDSLHCLNASVAGMLLAGVIYDNRLSMSNGISSFGGLELLDLITIVFILAWILDQFVYASSYLLFKFRKSQEHFEGDPT